MAIPTVNTGVSLRLTFLVILIWRNLEGGPEDVGGRAEAPRFEIVVAPLVLLHVAFSYLCPIV